MKTTDKGGKVVVAATSLCGNEVTTLAAEIWWKHGEHQSNESPADNLFIYSGYRVSDTEIRVALVGSVEAITQLTYAFPSLPYLDPQPLVVECQRSGECPAVFSPPCSISGYVGTIKDEKITGHKIEAIELSSGHSTVQLEIQDRRTLDSARPHQLGICVQPIFMLADWAIIIQFFEYWIQEGATKFYVYRESYTVDVQRVFELYQRVRGIDVELINWSKLPRVNEMKDPNNYWYRSVAHFVAQTDLDEIFQISSAKNLISLLQFVEQQHPNMASASFRSRRARVPAYWDTLASPSALNFAPFFELKLEKRVYERGVYSKNVYIPERVKRFDIHFLRETEKIPGSPKNESYVHVNVPAPSGVVLHLRKAETFFGWRGSSPTAELRHWASTAERAFQRRLAAERTGILNFTSSPAIGRIVLNAVESCRDEMYQRRKQQCHSVGPCELAAREAALNKVRWWTAPNSWIVM